MELRKLLIFDDDIYYQDTLFLLFNKEGRMIELNRFLLEEYKHSKYLYTNGRLTEVRSWSDVDSTTTRYHYSHNGCLSYAVTYLFENGNPKVYDTTKYHCDSLCRITMEIFHSFKDTVRCTYDENNNIVTWCNWERCDEGCDGCTRFIYDDLGRLVKEQHRHRFSNGDKVYTYNEEGYVSDYTVTFAFEEHIHYDYTYDSHGNWLTRTNGNTIVRRKITYFE